MLWLVQKNVTVLLVWIQFECWMRERERRTARRVGLSLETTTTTAWVLVDGKEGSRGEARSPCHHEGYVTVPLPTTPHRQPAKPTRQIHNHSYFSRPSRCNPTRHRLWDGRTLPDIRRARAQWSTPEPPLYKVFVQNKEQSLVRFSSLLLDLVGYNFLNYSS